jgi:hypothetical protein
MHTLQSLTCFIVKTFNSVLFQLYSRMHNFIWNAYTLQLFLCIICVGKSGTFMAVTSYPTKFIIITELFYY